MDEDHRELVRRLFAAATELIEAAHEAAAVIADPVKDDARAGLESPP